MISLDSLNSFMILVTAVDSLQFNIIHKFAICPHSLPQTQPLCDAFI